MWCLETLVRLNNERVEKVLRQEAEEAEVPLAEKHGLTRDEVNGLAVEQAEAEDEADNGKS